MLLCKVLRMRIDGDLIRMAIHLTGLLIVRIGLQIVVFFDSNGNPLYDTDWQDEATRTAISHNHQLNVQQGGEKSSMGAFLNYTDNQGIMLNTYSKTFECEDRL